MPALPPSRAKTRRFCSKQCYNHARSIENMVYKASVNGIKKIFVNLIYDAIRSMSGASIEWCAYTAVEVLCNFDIKKQAQ